VKNISIDRPPRSPLRVGDTKLRKRLSELNCLVGMRVRVKKGYGNIKKEHCSTEQKKRSREK